MDKGCVKRAVTLAVCRYAAAQGGTMCRRQASARHIHLSQADVAALFVSYKLRQFRPLTQPGQFAAEEKVDIVGPRAPFRAMRVLGQPEERRSRFPSDARLGIKPVVRMSGDIALRRA